MRIVSATVLVDTNVLVYAHDPRDRAKQRQALDVLDALVRSERATVSAQCLSEFYAVVTQRLPDRMRPRDALVQVERLAAACRVVDVTPAVVLEGCRAASQRGISIWDALIWAAAKLNQIRYVLTEDAEHESSLEGVTFLDPFAPRFDFSAVRG